MKKEILIQLLSDASVQVGDSYEERAILDSDFEAVADSILKIHEETVKQLNDENYELNRFYEDNIMSGDR